MPINWNLPEEILDITCNFAMVEFQGKMAVVYVFHNRIRQVSLEPVFLQDDGHFTQTIQRREKRLRFTMISNHSGFFFPVKNAYI